ncbi:hypothetical protein NDU88_003739 [Pleurodeles waltl]|uniref:Uncharacterized protein n=1 Tax=Pleurodeles waltl TaxID=8319 RepID=A0AAV7QFS1_PLEWA|nr:hypothetical protein NDU88_003739 [Pleurodeles waltl]
MAEKAAAVREALRVLCEAVRDDLIQPGILSQAWVGLERPRRATAGAVAVLACSPPQQRGNRNVNARCLGEQKLKKETALTTPSSFPNEAALDSEVKQGRRMRGGPRRSVSFKWAVVFGVLCQPRPLSKNGSKTGTIL